MSGIIEFRIQCVLWSAISFFVLPQSSFSAAINPISQNKVQECVTGIRVSGGANPANYCGNNETYSDIQLRGADGSVLTGLYTKKMIKCSDDPDAASPNPDCVLKIRGKATLTCGTGANCSRAATVSFGCTVEYSAGTDATDGAKYISRSLCKTVQQPVLTGMITDSNFTSVFDFPKCASGQTVEYKDFALRCIDGAKAPECAADEIVSYTGDVTGSPYRCIKKVPICTSGTYLSYYGNNWHCDPVSQPTSTPLANCDIVDCPNRGNYCTGNGYINSASNCVCAGTKDCGAVAPKVTSTPAPRAEPELPPCTTVSFCHLNRIYTAVCKNHDVASMTTAGVPCTTETRWQAYEDCKVAPANCL